MKRKCVVITIFLIVISLMLCSKVNATDLTKSDLIKLEVDGTERIVSKTTTIDEIKSWYGGEAKLETDSLWGGKAYSFYIGDKYDDYLYIETLEDGQIFSYGSVDETYETNTYSYGDDYPYSERNTLYGCLLSDDGTVIGGVYYYKSILEKGNTTKIIKKYKTAFGLDTDTDTLDDEMQRNAMLNLNKHATLMFNAIEKSTYNNEKGFLTFNEDYFYINQQFREFGTNLLSYMYNMDYPTSIYRALGTQTSRDLSYNGYYCMNPLLLAGMAILHGTTDFTERNYVVWDYNYETKVLIGDVFSKDCFERADEVSLTSTEIERLAAGRKEYEEAEACFAEAGDTIYETKPDASSGSGLVAGELTDANKEGITHYINAIRVAGGLNRLSVDEEAFNIAQHLSTLEAFCIEVAKIESIIFHWVDKDDCLNEGVSLSYWKTAMGYGNSYGSDISWIAVFASQSSMKSHIKGLIDDRANISGTNTAYGHRKDMLSPNINRFGFGITSSYAVVETTSKENDTEDRLSIVGWPSVNGVTFLETTYDSTYKFMWNCKFYSDSKYEVQDTSTTTIKCLNTGETWEFNEEVSSTKKYYQNLIDGDVFTSCSNNIVMYDSTIEPQAGYVYLVTINGLKNTETGEEESYSYRTVFEYADVDSYADSINKIDIEVPEELEEVSSGIYSAEIGSTYKLTATIDDTSVVDKKITWISSNSDVVSVTQNGIITVNKESDEDVVISVYFDGDTSITSQVKIRPTQQKELIYTTYETQEIDDVVVIVLSAGQTVSDILVSDNFPVIDDSYIVEVYNSSDEEKTGTEKVGSKNVIKITDPTGTNVVKEYTIVVKGDVNGDGKVKIYDAFQILKQVLFKGSSSFSNLEVLICDYNGDSKVKMYDAFAYLKQSLFGTK